ncbi:MAG TPA: hypothetical protein VK541_17590 [Pedobacter sp.]|uniref:fumarate hydratase n=1 Tax=Pedobacter sp. TaxID=1411316 RepID=UPI002C2511FA|nr:fumarate hydratase [Pedobacter sp.]HMI04306.1 hypothetical protein [Pedobacter sp.]
MRILFFSFLILCSLTACTRLPDIQGKGTEFLQGVWNQDSVANSDKLLNYTQHKFKFTCDSFYVDLTTRSSVNYYEDSCYNKGIWREYAKGTYLVRADTLFLAGTYTKANYKQKISGCYQIGQYIKSFKIDHNEQAKLMLENTGNQREISLKLEQKIMCIPQPL